MTLAAVALFTTSLLTTLLSHRVSTYQYKALLKTAGYSLLLALVALLHFTGTVDTVSYILAVFFTALSLLISVYTPLYAKSLHYPHGLELLVDGFLYSLIAAYIAPNLITLVSAWTLVEILGFMLIKLGEEHSLEGPLTSSRGFLLASTTTYELSVFTFIATSFLAMGVHPQLLLEPFTITTQRIQIPNIVLPLILLGFLTKAAITPLHFWLPSAHSTAPSPASAALSGFTVALGYYGLYRVLHYIDLGELTKYLGTTLVVLGLLSVLYGGIEALTQRDVKRLLAYSTILTNGFILTLFALYILTRSQQVLVLVIAGILTQATYKTTLFCEAGLLEVLYETRYMHLVRGLLRALPISSVGGILAVLSLIGVPGTLGFTLKIGSLYVTLNTLTVSFSVLVLLLVTLALYITLSAIIGVKYITLYYTQPPRHIPIVRTASRLHQLPVALLGVTSVVVTPLFLSLTGYTQLAAITAALTPIPLITVYLVIHAAKIPLRGGEVTST